MNKNIMKVIKTFDENNNIQSYYLVCYNHNSKYQAVAIPWCRIDYREQENEEEVFENIKKAISKKGWIAEWTDIMYVEYPCPVYKEANNK